MHLNLLCYPANVPKRNIIRPVKLSGTLDYYQLQWLRAQSIQNNCTVIEMLRRVLDKEIQRENLRVMRAEERAKKRPDTEG